MKVKTKRSAYKRFKVTKDGKVLRHKAYNRHLKTTKSAKKKRHLRKPSLVSSVEAKQVKLMLPYA
ncbi:MAG TPA: 50S ribosomal protein L35 [Candidatus Hydrogenedens sp.]|nr:50S ribosomal protein L35 [Candidatus Hydrogenedens sp.]HOK09932.1 50S ribosomal protein L35 [Candidatus Hydrogenedens sp.]HOL19654.1 50S ribosomal protein L35 [Candidatus Hydrogenedens sp.]HPP57720.1 50S ribosomal protein L35 [Candidatus Hydrogenedens sp.]